MNTSGVEPAGPETEVLIVGGGLTGLAMAVFLRAYGVRTLLVERHQGTSIHPRARGVSPRTMELLRGEGLEAAVRATDSAVALARNDGIEAMESLAGEVLAKLDQPYLSGVHADLSEFSPTRWCMCDQDELEPLLRAAATQRGADLRFGTRLVDYLDDGEAITARITGPAGESSVRARFLIAADGAASPLRERLGINLDGPGTLAHYLNIYFEADLSRQLGDRRFVLGYVINKQVRGALLPVDNGRRWMLHVPWRPDVEDESSFSGHRCADLVRAAAGIEDLAVRVRSVLPWEAAGRTAQRWQDGRVLLIGDAAHLMPPTGAFGSNTGVQDAHNLAWKLSTALRTGSTALLDSYQSERRPVAEATVEQAVLRSKDRPRLVGEPTPPPGGLIADTTVVFGARYQLGAVRHAAGDLPNGWDDSGRAVTGVRAPHAMLRRGDRDLAVLDLLDHDWVLFGYGTAPALPSDQGDRFGLPLHCYRVVSDAEAVSAGSGGAITAELIDMGGSWAARWAVEPGDVVLVRPDGIVAWRGSGPDAGEQALSVLDELVGTTLSRL